MAFTEFYCQNGGSNLNAGSTTNNTAAYTSTNGNWSSGTNIFTPTDGSTPSSSVSVGDWVSIYNDAATQGVFIARVTAVGAGVNGTITVSSAAKAGTAPSTSATGRSIKAGGAWKGPNGANVTVPLGYSSLSNATDASTNPPRINLKNDQTYSISSGITMSSGANALIVQGYSSMPGDGGRATIDGGSNAINLITIAQAYCLIDLVFTGSATTGTNDAIVFNGQAAGCIRVTVTGARGNGWSSSFNQTYCIECEANNCNRSNTSGNAGFKGSSQSIYLRCVATGNTGSNTDGFAFGAGAGGPVLLIDCISTGNGRHGLSFAPGSISQLYWILNFDAYNNGGDGIKNLETTGKDASFWIENSNFVKNTGWGVNSALTTGKWMGFLYNSGFGSGTQINGSGDTNGTDNLQILGKVTYASGVTPWVAPSTGNFSINLGAAMNAGRGNFTETQGSYSGTVGYPDIGAAQALITSGGKSSHVFCG